MPKPTDSKAMLFVAFALTLAAGLAGGMLLSRARAIPATTVTQTSPLDELQLSADQTAQMRRIWEAVRNSAQEYETRGTALRLQRDKAMENLLTDEQKAKFEKVNLDYNAQLTAMDAQRKAAFGQAVSETEKMLNPTQRATYQRILRQRNVHEAGLPLADPPPSSGSVPVSSANAGAIILP
ncbi:MAG TPA: hypothetical protein VH370_22815 [Humisphaera sp.]|jgi:Spy/CpxP family protein refolding chaperone|nr:hypothetical protein [Humisphaera sp.]